MLSVHQCHGQTDGRTDGRHYDSNTALALRASRGKNEIRRARRLRITLAKDTVPLQTVFRRKDGFVHDE